MGRPHPSEQSFLMGAGATWQRRRTASYRQRPTAPLMFRGVIRRICIQVQCEELASKKDGQKWGNATDLLHGQMFQWRMECEGEAWPGTLYTRVPKDVRAAAVACGGAEGRWGASPVLLPGEEWRKEEPSSGTETQGRSRVGTCRRSVKRPVGTGISLASREDKNKDRSTKIRGFNHVTNDQSALLLWTGISGKKHHPYYPFSIKLPLFFITRIKIIRSNFKWLAISV